MNKPALSVPRRFLATLALAACLSAQPLPLLIDLNQTPEPPASSLPQHMTRIGNAVLFSAHTPREGRELYRSDGTTAGTFLLADLELGPHSTHPFPLASLGSGGVLASRIPSGHRLWRTDGTAAGTVAFTDIPVFNYPGLAAAASLGSIVVFAAQEPSGWRLVRTDGTAVGTRVLAVIGEPKAHVVVGNRYLMTDTTGLLTSTDGTGAGTVYLQANVGGTLAVRGNLAYFPVGSSQIWETDGTVAGTRALASFPPTSTPVFQLVTAGDLFLQAPDFLLVSDGTAAGTRVLAAFLRGTPSALTAVGNSVFFFADDAVNGQELWTSDGTAAGTTLVADLSPGTASTEVRAMARLGNRVVFSASTPQDGFEPWVSDGTVSGTASLASRPLTDEIAPTGFTLDPSGGGLLFTGNDAVAGFELWRTDGTAAGTQVLVDLWSASRTQGSHPSQFRAVNGRMLFHATDANMGRELWTTDGTVAGTAVVRDINPGPDWGTRSWSTAVFRGQYYFEAIEPATGTELWRSDGTSAGTQMVLDLEPGVAGSGPTELAVAGDRALVFAAWTFATGNELVLSDGTAAGTVVVDLQPGPAGSNPFLIRGAGNLVFFSALASVWATDGTVAGTRQVSSITPSDVVRSFAVLDGAAYFASGGAIWRSDGTPLGTVQVVPSSVVRIIGDVHAGLGQLFFTGSDPQNGVEPWVSDGTPAGTHLLADLTPGAGSSYPNYFVEVDAGVLFLAGGSLWRTRGTAQGTTRLGTFTSASLAGVVGSRRVWMASGDGLLRSDGTSGGTSVVGPASSVALAQPFRDLVIAGLDDQVHGSELWVLDRAAHAVALGHGCSGGGFPPTLRVQDPVLGASMALVGGTVPAGAVGAVLLGVPLPRPILLPGNCGVHVDPSLVLGVLATTPLPRGFTAQLSVPATPALAGARLVAQAVVAPGSTSMGIDLTNAASLTLGR